MKILSVKAKDFRAYPEIHWHLPESGLFMIDAITDTGRSNMAGKSTLIDSIFWALFGWLPKWNGPKGGLLDSVIRRNSSSAQVELEVENNGALIKIIRNRPNKLQVFLDGKEIHGKSLDLDNRIEQLIGMTANQFLLSVYIAQDRGSSFFTMTDGERTSLLSTIAGLEELDRGLEEAKKRKESIQTNLDRAEGALSAMEEQYNAIPNQKSRCQGEVAVFQSEMEATSINFANVSRLASQEESAATQELHAALLHLQTERDSEISNISTEWDELSERIEQLTSKLSQHSEIDPKHIKEISQIKSKIAQIEKHNQEQERAKIRNVQRTEEIRKILDQAEQANKGRCSSCEQELPQAQRESRTKKILEQAQKIESEIEPEKDLINDEELKFKLEKANKDLENEKNQHLESIYQIKQDLSAAKSSISVIESNIWRIHHEFDGKKTKKEMQHNQQLYSIRQKAKDAEAEFKNKQLILAQSIKNIKSIENQEKELELKVKQIQNDVASLKDSMNEVLDLIDLFGPKGFRSVCFDGLIERISQRASQLFSLMTDGIYSTSLYQLKDDSKGSQKLVLRPTVLKGGQEVPIDDLSGGAKRMIMLAYDVAVSETVATDAPLFLDEALDGLDVVGKSEAMRLLEAVSSTRPVFVIDHSSEFKSSFNHILTVIHKNGESYLKQ